MGRRGPAADLAATATSATRSTRQHPGARARGAHRYFFVIHALDVEKIGVPEDATPAFLNFNFLGHILGRAILTVTAEITG